MDRTHVTVGTPEDTTALTLNESFACDAAKECDRALAINKPDELPDDAVVIRFNSCGPEALIRSAVTHHRMCEVEGKVPEFAISVFSKPGLTPAQIAEQTPIPKIDNISVATAGAIRHAGYVIRADEEELKGHYLVVFPRRPTSKDGETLRALFKRRRVTRGKAKWL